MKLIKTFAIHFLTLLDVWFGCIIHNWVKLISQKKTVVECKSKTGFLGFLICIQSLKHLYKTLQKYSMYNLTFYESQTQKGFCYLWDECDAKRGSNEVATCLTK